MADKVIFEPIGTIRTPFKTPDNMPVQPAGGKDVEGWVEHTERRKPWPEPQGLIPLGVSPVRPRSRSALTGNGHDAHACPPCHAAPP